MKKASLTKTLLDPMSGQYEKQGRDEFTAGEHDFLIDTCYASDVMCYETCIFKDDDGGTNVEHYDTPAQATIGHKKWVEKLKNDPNTVLIEQNEYGL